MLPNLIEVTAQLYDGDDTDFTIDGEQSSTHSPELFIMAINVVIKKIPEHWTWILKQEGLLEYYFLSRYGTILAN